MHCRMLVTLSKPLHSTSESVRMDAFDALMQDTTFCSDVGRFTPPLCDWFVIGGRWSGLLAETQMDSAYRAALIARFPEMAKGYWPDALTRANTVILNAIWMEHGGTGPSPYTRNSYAELGYPDDAQVITGMLYDRLLARYEGEDCAKDHGCCEFVDLDRESLAPSFIDRKWAVLIDYHC